MMLRSILITFVAGALSVVAFHQSIVWLLYQAGQMPPGFEPWSMNPVPPLAVPTLLSKAFWGGVWALVIAQCLASLKGLSYWAGWTLAGAIALPLVAIFVVPLIKGVPIPPFSERFPLYAFINAFWGLGAALFLRVLDPRTH